MEETNRGVIFMDLPAASSRSVSPMSPSPCRDKNLGFFHALGRRFCRQSREDLSNGEDDSRSSSMDSCSSTSAGRLTSQEKQENTLSIELSCSASDTSSETTKSNTQRSRSSKRSSSIKRALQSLSLSSRSLSCSNTPLKNSVIKQKKVKVITTPQRILRQPVSYTYLKGMSGLPTQRVPRSSICCSHTCR